MTIALFADIHGKFLLPFKLCDYYQQSTGERIDLILQCGDLGAFPDLARLDKATIRHAAGDRDELGFHDDFLEVNADIQAFLDRLDLDMIAVRGNHEDHDFLDGLEAQSQETRFPIDAYNRVFVCKSGQVQTIQKNGQTVQFVGVGRIGDRKGRNDGRYIQDYEREAIRKTIQLDQAFDFLISHDSCSYRPEDFGMLELGQLLENIPFAYHFFGHSGEPFRNELDENGLTRSVKIKELEFTAAGNLPEGCMVILKKEDYWKLSIVPQEITNPFTKHQWRYL